MERKERKERSRRLAELSLSIASRGKSPRRSSFNIKKGGFGKTTTIDLMNIVKMSLKEKLMATLKPLKMKEQLFSATKQ